MGGTMADNVAPDKGDVERLRKKLKMPISKFYYDRLQMTVFGTSAPHIRTMYAAVRLAQSSHFRSVIANFG
jgi:hypothetical protein